jgi:hypothetical protein
LMSKCFRIDYENCLRGQKKQTRTHVANTTPNQNEKLDGRMIRTTVVSRTVRELPFGIDKTEGSHAYILCGQVLGQESRSDSHPDRRHIHIEKSLAIFRSNVHKSTNRYINAQKDT